MRGLGQLNIVVFGKYALAIISFTVGFAGLALYSRYDHTIWVDEYLHFAFAGFSNSGRAWQAIRESLLTFNFNQTGIYMIADYWLLKIFGASAFALRLPSLASTVWVLLCTYVFFGVRGFGPVWRLVGVLAVVAQGSLMDFAAEARPYMPLAASVVGTLTFYLCPLAERRPWMMTIGVISMVWGALMHPYFPGYWVAIIVLGFVTAVLEGQCRVSVRDFVRYCDVRLLVLGMAIYVILGSLTWMRGAPSLTFDPFQWVHRDKIIEQFFDRSHLKFIYPFRIDSRWIMFGPRRVALYLMIAIVLAYPFLSPKLRTEWKGLLPPLMLVLGAFILSGVLCVLSYIRHYWILDRQWIASLALMPIAVSWYAASLARIMDRFYRGAGVMLALLCLCVFAASFRGGVVDQLAVLRADANRPATVAIEGPIAEGDTDAWVALANANIDEGGPVWSVFAKFYGQQ